MNDVYNPKSYWEQRLGNSFNLKGVGHISFSPYYNSWLYRRKRICIESCLHDIQLKGKDVLDIGCGTGFFVEWYLSKGAKVCGVDITEISIQEMRRRYNAEFLVLDISSPDFQSPRKFDVVNMWDVIYHVVDTDAFHRALENISQCLNPGGYFLFTDWFGSPNDFQAAPHVQPRCLKTYINILNKKGFELVQLNPLYSVLNKSHFGRLDNYLAPAYFVIDRFAKKISNDNLSLSLWRFNPPDHE